MKRRTVLSAVLLTVVLLYVSKGEALSLSCTQTLLAVRPCLDTPSGPACCNPARAANDDKCLCDPGIFDLARQYGVKLDASNITQIALNCGFPITTVALAGTSNCPYVPGATVAPALAKALNSTATLQGNYTVDNTTFFVVTVGNTSFATNCTAANVTASLNNPLNATLLTSLNCTALNATNSTNLTQAFPLLTTLPASAQVPPPSSGRPTCCKIPLVSYFCGWFGSGCS
ncbi:hypothetical protein KFL_002330040 [Klebsormidium nitens]|uniref:Bifunctional inhibitor/plant lipid transfer protein/seed storage helical domain-containing protein n=1 Tax=Klebsormidium nitens TaxID=105231 RepID=A0A1Y1I388_KLENI|nr:hypothetical protein KFL_002330040 [Klebsormidium nitens]|eukprot:GAQ85394.1 hypothetical protein KFL_002330040 [Klebsormidium nitens]